MTPKVNLLIVLCLSCAMTAFGQRHAAAQSQPAPAPAPQAPATDTVAPDIPGVVKGGTKVEVVKQGFRATDGPVPLPDGSIIFWNFPEKTIVKIDKDGNDSTFLTQGMGVGRSGAQAITVDAKGRIITLDKDKVSTRIAVVYPKGSETVIADTCEGKPLPEPNDLIADKKGGVYFNADAVYYVRPDGTCGKVQAESRSPERDPTQSGREDSLRHHAGQGATCGADEREHQDGRRPGPAGVRHPARRQPQESPCPRQVQIHPPAAGSAPRSTIRRGRPRRGQPRAASTRPPRQAYRSSARRGSTWARFLSHGIPRTSPSEEQTRKRFT